MGAGCTANNDNGLSDLGSRVIVTLMRRRQGGTVGQAGFRQHAMHVILGRSQGNEQIAGDLFVALALGDQSDDLAFAGRGFRCLRAEPHEGKEMSCWQ